VLAPLWFASEGGGRPCGFESRCALKLRKMVGLYQNCLHRVSALTLLPSSAHWLIVQSVQILQKFHSPFHIRLQKRACVVSRDLQFVLFKRLRKQIFNGPRSTLLMPRHRQWNPERQVIAWSGTSLIIFVMVVPCRFLGSRLMSQNGSLPGRIVCVCVYPERRLRSISRPQARTSNRI
jgi:hypothetical protein